MNAQNLTADVLQLLAAQLAWFLAVLLGAAAAHKVIRWPQTQSVVQRFGGVPRPLASGASAAAVAVELVAAAALMCLDTRMAGAVTAAVLWSAYSVLLLRAIVLDQRDLDCGCSFGSEHRPLGVFQLARNAALVILALAVAVISLRGAITAPASQVLAAFALLALYAALDQVMALRPLRSGEVS